MKVRHENFWMVDGNLLQMYTSHKGKQDSSQIYISVMHIAILQILLDCEMNGLKENLQ